MKEITADEVIREILKKKDKCTVIDMSNWKDEYNKKHPDDYVDICSETICWAIEMNPDEFYWGGEGDEGLIVLKQEVVYCPACGDKHRKYPNTEAFEVLSNLRKHFI